ncbi:helix-turn-helix domain-containing protein [Citrobacter werkmanii]|uniref:helix-turn-helix domain-containing protein n=1 Tax=Citrobacter werkmanii TaxID=67827 RepID=UPI003455E1A6
MSLHSTLTGLPASTVISSCLDRLCLEPVEIRCKRSVSDYIIDKSNLSRSTVNKILADCKKEGQLVMNAGILISWKEYFNEDV